MPTKININRLQLLRRAFKRLIFGQRLDRTNRLQPTIDIIRIPDQIAMGFDITRFESTVDDELICAICEGVLQNPIQVVSCEHVFCSDCLDQWIAKGKKNCPLDREAIKGGEDMKAPRIVINLLAKTDNQMRFR